MEFLGIIIQPSYIHMIIVFPTISEAAAGAGGKTPWVQTYVRRLWQCDVSTCAEVLSAQYQGHRRRSHRHVQRQPISEQRHWCVQTNVLFLMVLHVQKYELLYGRNLLNCTCTSTCTYIYNVHPSNVHVGLHKVAYCTGPVDEKVLSCFRFERH